MGLSPKPWSPSPQPLAWLYPASSLPVSGPGRARRAVRRGSHCPRCPHRELSSPSATALTFPLQGESWGRGNLALLLSPLPLSTSQPGREVGLEHKPFLPGTPAHLSTFRAQH